MNKTILEFILHYLALLVIILYTPLILYFSGLISSVGNLLAVTILGLIALIVDLIIVKKRLQKMEKKK